MNFKIFEIAAKNNNIKIIPKIVSYKIFVKIVLYVWIFIMMEFCHLYYICVVFAIR